MNGGQPSCNPTPRWGCRSLQPVNPQPVNPQPVPVKPAVNIDEKNNLAINKLAQNLDDQNRTVVNDQHAVDHLQNTLNNDNQETAIDRLSENLQADPGQDPAEQSLSQSYVLAVCLNSYDVTEACLGKTPEQASAKLAEMILKQYFKNLEVQYFRLVMPSATPSVEQIQWLRKIEGKTIDMVEARMLADIKSMKAFQWDTEAVKQEKQNSIMEDARRARREAAAGTNWSHNWGGAAPSHDFHEGEGLRELKDIATSGWQSQ
jgi:hypothetical protein